MLKKRFKKLTKSLSLGLILVLSLFFGLSPAGVGQASEIMWMSSRFSCWKRLTWKMPWPVVNLPLSLVVRI